MLPTTVTVWVIPSIFLGNLRYLLFPSTVLDFCPLQRWPGTAGGGGSARGKDRTRSSPARKELRAAGRHLGYSTLHKAWWGVRRAHKYWRHSHYPVPLPGSSVRQLPPFTQQGLVMELQHKMEIIKKCILDNQQILTFQYLQGEGYKTWKYFCEKNISILTPFIKVFKC